MTTNNYYSKSCRRLVDGFKDIHYSINTFRIEQSVYTHDTNKNNINNDNEKDNDENDIDNNWTIVDAMSISCTVNGYNDDSIVVDTDCDEDEDCVVIYDCTAHNTVPVTIKTTVVDQAVKMNLDTMSVMTVLRSSCLIDEKNNDKKQPSSSSSTSMSSSLSFNDEATGDEKTRDQNEVIVRDNADSSADSILWVKNTAIHNEEEEEESIDEFALFIPNWSVSWLDKRWYSDNESHYIVPKIDKNDENNEIFYNNNSYNKRNIKPIHHHQHQQQQQRRRTYLNGKSLKKLHKLY